MTSEDAFLELSQMDTQVSFYHQNDERAYFEWLERIACIETFQSDGQRGLVVYLKRAPRDEELWELLAVCFRFGVDMRQLAKFETEKNRAWFRDPQKYWYQGVFKGPSGPVASRLSPSAGQIEVNLELRAELMRQIETIIRTKGWEQREVAAQLGLTQPCVSYLLRGQTERFSLDELVNIAAALGQRVGVKLDAA